MFPQKGDGVGVQNTRVKFNSYLSHSTPRDTNGRLEKWASLEIYRLDN